MTEWKYHMEDRRNLYHRGDLVGYIEADWGWLTRGNPNPDRWTCYLGSTVVGYASGESEAMSAVETALLLACTGRRR